jgi:GNAT superfamily N-acetyltransferase
VTGVDAADVRVRDATADDLPGAFRVAWRCDHGAGEPEPTDPGRLHYLEHELATGRMAVAEGAAGEIVAMGGTVVRGGLAMVSDLFVDPDWHGKGLGQRVLSAVLGDRWPRQTFSSAHPHALPLYIRFGMAPRWPCLYVTGDPRVALSEDFNKSVAVEPDVKPASLADVERAWGGPFRPEDHVYWGTGLRRAASLEIGLGGRPIGYAYLSDDPPLDEDTWWISALQVGPQVEPAASAAALGAVFAHAADRGIERLGLSLPGPHPATIPLIRAGWRIVDRDQYVASESGLLDPERRVPDPTFG